MSMESGNVEGTIEHVRNCPEVHYEDNKIVVESKIRDFSSAAASSSSSSRSSFDIGLKSPVRGQESITSLDYTVQTPQWSISSASPPFQTMGHPTSYDPNRIPSSVFSSAPANASEWSIASNDSLFSIHVGNNSFSRDSMWRSGELFRLDELNNSESLSGPESQHNELGGFPSSLPPVIEASAHEESGLKPSNASRVDSEGFNNSLKIAPEATKMTVTSTTTSLSDESGRSSSSFAFPVLVNDGGKAGSLKGPAEKPVESELQTGDPKATHQRSSIGRWFIWFSCMPRCC